MMGGLFKRSNQKIVLSIDFGGEAVKAVLFKKEKDKSSILGYSVQSFESFGIFDISGLEQDNVKKIISKTLEQIREQSDKKIEEICVRLPADILKGQIFSEIYKREAGRKKITKKEQEDIRRAMLEAVKREISKNYALKTGIMPRDIYFPTLKIFQTKIDGYKTPSLEGFCGETVEFKIFKVGKYQKIML
jgi:cell division ATPase FtsA